MLHTTVAFCCSVESIPCPKPIKILMKIIKCIAEGKSKQKELELVKQKIVNPAPFQSSETTQLHVVSAQRVVLDKPRAIAFLYCPGVH